MIYNRFSRRMFLRGAGGTLAIPFLESLVPKAFAQTPTPPIRYVQMINPYSPGVFGIYGSASSGVIGAVKANPAILQTVSPQVRKMLLSELPAGQIAPTIGPELSALRNKFSLLRGLDILKVANDRSLGHGFTMPTCASGPIGDDQYAAPVSGHPSIDCVLADSLKIYPQGFANNRKLINLGPPGRDLYRSYETASFSWRKTQNGLERVPLMQNTFALRDLLTIQTGQQPPLNGKVANVLDKVLEDYTRVTASTRISAKDKNRLQDYMDLISDLKSGFGGQGGGACPLPAIGSDTDAELQFINQIRLLAASMACGSTRVASIALHFNIATVPDAHGVHHALTSNPADARWANTMAYYDNMKLFSKRMAFLMQTFDGVMESNGTTLLDNSVIYWGQEFGIADGWGQHSREDFPAIIAGGGGGKLAHGHYIDYRKYPNAVDLDSHNGISMLRGVPLNNLLVTLMSCMGLDYTDYELDAGKGFGYYPMAPEYLVATNGANRGQLGIPNEDFWFSTAGRRSTLPVLFTG